LGDISSRAFNEARAAVIIGSLDTTLTLKLSASSLLFDLNSEARTARTNQISAIIAPV
jgi:hypothetical protein